MASLLLHISITMNYYFCNYLKNFVKFIKGNSLKIFVIILYALNKWKDVSEIIDRSGLCTLV